MPARSNRFPIVTAPLIESSPTRTLTGYHETLNKLMEGLQLVFEVDDNGVIGDEGNAIMEPQRKALVRQAGMGHVITLLRESAFVIRNVLLETAVLPEAVISQASSGAIADGPVLHSEFRFAGLQSRVLTRAEMRARATILSVLKRGGSESNAELTKLIEEAQTKSIVPRRVPDADVDIAPRSGGDPKTGGRPWVLRDDARVEQLEHGDPPATLLPQSNPAPVNADVDYICTHVTVQQLEHIFVGLAGGSLSTRDSVPASSRAEAVGFDLIVATKPIRISAPEASRANLLSSLSALTGRKYDAPPDKQRYLLTGSSVTFGQGTLCEMLSNAGVLIVRVEIVGGRDLLGHVITALESVTSAIVMDNGATVAPSRQPSGDSLDCFGPATTAACVELAQLWRVNSIDNSDAIPFFPTASPTLSARAHSMTIDNYPLFSLAGARNQGGCILHSVRGLAGLCAFLLNALSGF